MDQPKRKGRANMMRLLITGGLSLVVLISLGFAAFNLDLTGFDFDFTLAPAFVALVCFSALPVFETLRLAALARLETSGGIRAWGINAAAMALVQAPLGIIGAEAYRASAYARRGEALSLVLAAILVARALGFASMMVLMALAAGFLTDALPPPVRVLSALASLVGFLTILFGPTLLRRIGPIKAPGRLAAFIAALSELTARQLSGATVWSALVVVARALALWACAAAVGMPISLAFAVFASAAGLFIALIPFASGVVGVREGGIAGVLLLAGVPFAAGVLIGFAMRLGAIAGALVGMGLSRMLVPEARR